MRNIGRGEIRISETAYKNYRAIARDRGEGING